MDQNLENNSLTWEKDVMFPTNDLLLIHVVSYRALFVVIAAHYK